MSDEVLRRWLAMEQCKDVALRFMALFDSREYAAMEALVVPQLEWQRPDRTIRGVEELRQVLEATSRDVRVRHVITNARATFEADDRVVVESYFTVYRHTGIVDGPAPLVGPASIGRYRDELMLRNGVWQLVLKRTFVDFWRG